MRQGLSVYPWLSWNSLCHQAGLKLSEIHTSASQVSGLKVCATTPNLGVVFIFIKAIICYMKCFNIIDIFQYVMLALGVKCLMNS